MTQRTNTVGSRRHVVIVGLMGVGKSTLGEALAAELGLEYVDSDADIEQLTGRTGREIADSDGIRALHELEATVLLSALDGQRPLVIGAAASTVEREAVRAAMSDRALVVRLVLPTDQALARQAQGGHRRPMDRSELQALAERREPLFSEVEDLKLTADQNPDVLVSEVLDAFPGLSRLA